MKAIVKDKDQPGFSISEIDEPKCSTKHVLIKVRACGVCGTDMYTYRWDNWIRDMIRPHMPVVIGHEFGGEIVEKGSEVSNLEVGERVVVEPVISCGHCDFCQTNRPNICRKWVSMGLQCDGAMTGLVAAPEGNCFKVPETIPFADISLIEVLATGIHAFERLRGPIAGSIVAILGIGTIGLLLLQAARVYGAAKIIVIATSRSKARLETARQMGADEIIMVDKDDLMTKINALTDGGADIVFEAAGTASGCQEALQVGRKGSQVVLMGPCESLVNFIPLQLIVNEMDIISSNARRPSSWRTAINLVASKNISLENIIDARFSVFEGLEAFELLDKREITKAVIEP